MRGRLRLPRALAHVGPGVALVRDEAHETRNWADVIRSLATRLDPGPEEEKPRFAGLFLSGARRARTAQLVGANQALSQLTLGPRRPTVYRRRIKHEPFEANTAPAPLPGREE